MLVDVNVRLTTPGSCAGIWFRFRANAGYQVRACETAVLVGTHKDADVEVYKTFPLEQPIAPGGAGSRITLRVVGGTVTVSRDDAEIGSVQLTDPGITGGRVALGIFTEAETPGRATPYEVVFDHVTVRKQPV